MEGNIMQSRTISQLWPPSLDQYIFGTLLYVIISSENLFP